MADTEQAGRIHELDVTLWVGKRGPEAVTEELTDQLENADLVKVKFHDAARAGQSTEELAVELGEAAGASVVETRGHTAVYEE